MSVGGQQALLIWAKNRTRPYGLDVVDFHKSWMDGRAICAVIHYHCPKTMDWQDIENALPYARTTIATNVAEGLNMNMFLDPEDWLVIPKPDKLSIMTTLSEIYLFFKNPENSGTHITIPGGPLKASELSDDVINDAKDFEKQRIAYFEKKALKGVQNLRTESGKFVIDRASASTRDKLLAGAVARATKKVKNVEETAEEKAKRAAEIKKHEERMAKLEKERQERKKAQAERAKERQALQAKRKAAAGASFRDIIARLDAEKALLRSEAVPALEKTLKGVLDVDVVVDVDYKSFESSKNDEQAVALDNVTTSLDAIASAMEALSNDAIVLQCLKHSLTGINLTHMAGADPLGKRKQIEFDDGAINASCCFGASKKALLLQSDIESIVNERIATSAARAKYADVVDDELAPVVDAVADADIAQLAAKAHKNKGDRPEKRDSVPAGRSKGSTLRRRLRKRESIVSPAAEKKLKKTIARGRLERKNSLQKDLDAADASLDKLKKKTSLRENKDSNEDEKKSEKKKSLKKTKSTEKSKTTVESDSESSDSEYYARLIAEKKAKLEQIRKEAEEEEEMALQAEREARRKRREAERRARDEQEAKEEEARRARRQASRDKQHSEQKAEEERKAAKQRREDELRAQQEAEDAARERARVEAKQREQARQEEARLLLEKQAQQAIDAAMSESSESSSDDEDAALNAAAERIAKERAERRERMRLEEEKAAKEMAERANERRRLRDERRKKEEEEIAARAAENKRRQEEREKRREELAAKLKEEEEESNRRLEKRRKEREERRRKLDEEAAEEARKIEERRKAREKRLAELKK